MVLLNSQPEGTEAEGAVLAVASEDKEEEEDDDDEDEESSEDEIGSEEANDSVFVDTHQAAGWSEGGGAARERELLKTVERGLLAQRNGSMEKQRSLAIFRQTMTVQMRIRELGIVLEKMRAANRGRRLDDINAELAHTLEENRRAKEQLKIFEASVAGEDEGAGE